MLRSCWEGNLLHYGHRLSEFVSQPIRNLYTPA